MPRARQPNQGRGGGRSGRGCRCAASPLHARRRAGTGVPPLAASSAPSSTPPPLLHCTCTGDSLPPAAALLASGRRVPLLLAAPAVQRRPSRGRKQRCDQVGCAESLVSPAKSAVDRLRCLACPQGCGALRNFAMNDENKVHNPESPYSLNPVPRPCPSALSRAARSRTHSRSALSGFAASCLSSCTVQSEPCLVYYETLF